MKKRYFVVWVTHRDTRNIYNSAEIRIDHSVAAISTPGMLAEMLERKISKEYEDSSVVIINFWEM